MNRATVASVHAFYSTPVANNCWGFLGFGNEDNNMLKRTEELLTQWDLDLNEETKAAWLAKKLGLKHRGFGMWANHKNEVTHITRHGKLEMIKKLRDWLSIYDKMVNRGRKSYDYGVRIDTGNKLQKDLADALTLWSAGDISLVKKPKGWKKLGLELSNRNISVDEDGANIHHVTQSKSDYEKASIILRELAQQTVPAKTKPLIYRGMNLTPEEAEELIVGLELDLGDIASFTESIDVAQEFIGDPSKTVGVVFSVDPNSLKRGMSIKHMSDDYSEMEFLSSGSFRVNSVKESEFGGNVEVELEQV